MTPNLSPEASNASHMSSDLIYDTTLFFWKLVINTFFREIRPRGAFHIPHDGPVIFVAAPHHNQFLDMLLALQVYRETGRRVQFLVAAHSMNRKFIGFFARLIRSIPVVRAQDNAKPSIGRLSLSEDDPCLVLGHGTRFIEEFKPQMQILLPKSAGAFVAEVAEVISDTQLIIKREFGSDSRKGTNKIREKLAELRAQGVEGIEFKKIPYVDQAETYQHVYEALSHNGCITIFPEGGSHDRTDLLPLKAGVSVMALGAMANNPDVKVKVVPVGLSYFHPHKFRSRAVVEFGNAMDVPEALVEEFKQGGPHKREAVGKLLDLIYNGLKTVTIRAPDYDTLMLIQAARRLYVTPGQHLTLGQVVELNKRFLEAYVQFKDEPRVQKLCQDVLKYNRILRDLGLLDHQVPGARKASWKTFGLLCYRICLLSIWTTLALPGVILNGPIFLTASVISRKKAKEALAASVVKLEGRDVLATWKVLISLGLTPLLFTFYAVLATLVMIKANAPTSWIMWTPFVVISALPVIAYAALKFGEAGMDVLKSLRPLVIALAPGQQQYLDHIKDMRISLANELSEIIGEYGPKIYEDFDETRILVPSASVPPSYNQGLLHRKSRDPQGRFLNHPMSWLDERLFGWSPSAPRYRGSSDIGRDDSDTTKPVYSDDDLEDYDKLLGYMDSPRLRPSSRSSSYADLRVRKAVSSAQLMANPTLDADGLPVVPRGGL